MKPGTLISRSTAGSRKAAGHRAGARPGRVALAGVGLLGAALVAGAPPPALGQDAGQAGTAAAASSEPEALPSPVLTLDQDAMFAGSAFGQRVQQALQRDRAALAQENRRIEAELVEEELELTRLRASTPPEAFSEMANAFDRKVQQVRETQDGKSLQLQQQLDRERQTFLNEAGPVIAALVRQRGAFVVLDRSVILLSFEGVDITEDAIAAIDASIGSGAGGKLGPPLPLQRPGRAGGADDGAAAEAAAGNDTRTGAENAPQPDAQTGPQTGPQAGPQIAPGAGAAPGAEPGVDPDAAAAPRP